MDPKLKQLFEQTVSEKKLPILGAFLVNDKGEFLQKETFGRLNADDAESAPFTADSVTRMASCSKVITSIAAIQLIEQGKLSLTDLAEQYVPEIAKLQVLESVTAGEKPEAVLRPAKAKPTVHDLMTHTSGLTYDFFDTPSLTWRSTTSRPPSLYYGVGDWVDFETPYGAEPGTKWVYGTSTDWLAVVIQRVSGVPFMEHIEKSIFQPIGMTKSGDTIGAGRVELHMKVGGNVFTIPDQTSAQTTEVPAGGGFLCSTMDDYALLLSTILNQGTSPKTGQQVLTPDAVKKYLLTDCLPPGVDKSDLGFLGPGNPQLTNAATFLPTVPKDKLGYSCGGLLINDQDLPSGRKAGSGAWTGMFNLYYWIDPTSKLAGMVLSSLLPFMEPTALEMFDQFERTVYGHGLAAEGELEGRNYAMGKV